MSRWLGVSPWFGVSLWHDQIRVGRKSHTGKDGLVTLGCRWLAMACRTVTGRRVACTAGQG
jgi:hypothetical protein